MCIRDSASPAAGAHAALHDRRGDMALGGRLARWPAHRLRPCLLYTSDAADERSSVDLGGRRIIKKQTTRTDRESTSTDK